MNTPRATVPDAAMTQASGTERRTNRDDRGAALVPLVVATGVLLVIVTVVINVIVFQYGKGVVRSALDEAARAGSRNTSGPAECEARASNVLADLLGGQMGSGVQVSCAEDATRIIATATVHFDGWFGSISDYDTTLVASASKENR
jgi:Flp pilus assembly protein TadG